MSPLAYHLSILAAILSSCESTAYFTGRDYECGPYGFVCEAKSKLRLCDGDTLKGPAFVCPAGTICNEESSDVCENVINYVEPIISALKCRRYERIADPNVPGCKGYILCIPNKSRFQGIKFQCTGNTFFNGYTRTCTAATSYKCPMASVTKIASNFFEDGSQRDTYGLDVTDGVSANVGPEKTRPIDCKNYKLTVTQDSSPVRATYFCPRRPAQSGVATKCTVFSNQFCIILERMEEDQFIPSAASRRPRINSNVN